MDARDRKYVGIEPKLFAQIKEYCTLNSLSPTGYINSLLKDAFMRDKYGDRPFQTKVKAETVDHDGVAYSVDELKKAVEEYGPKPGDIKTLSAEKGEIPVVLVPREEVPVAPPPKPVGEVPEIANPVLKPTENGQEQPEKPKTRIVKRKIDVK